MDGYNPANTNYPRTDICGRIDRIPLKNRQEIDCGEPLIGKHVWVVGDNLGYNRRLTLCEIEVYASEGAYTIELAVLILHIPIDAFASRTVLF